MKSTCGGRRPTEPKAAGRLNKVGELELNARLLVDQAAQCFDLQKLADANVSELDSVR